MMPYVTVGGSSIDTLQCLLSASKVRQCQTLFYCLPHKQHATVPLHESIYTSRCLGTTPLRCMHKHTHTHTQTHMGWPSDEISFCHLACCVTRCISPAKASAAARVLSLSGVSLKATHTAEEPRTLGNRKSMAATL